MKCINCDAVYEEEDNYNGICVYHPGAYGRCGAIKRGNGWTCCGREFHEKGCIQQRHEITSRRHGSLIDDLEIMMKKNNTNTAAGKRHSAPGELTPVA